MKTFIQILDEVPGLCSFGVLQLPLHMKCLLEADGTISRGRIPGSWRERQATRGPLAQGVHTGSFVRRASDDLPKGTGTGLVRVSYSVIQRILSSTHFHKNTLFLTFIMLIRKASGSAWVAHSVERPTLDFHLRVVGSGSVLRGRVCLRFSPSALPAAHTLFSLSLK